MALHLPLALDYLIASLDLFHQPPHNDVLLSFLSLFFFLQLAPTAFAAPFSLSNEKKYNPLLHVRVAIWLSTYLPHLASYLFDSPSTNSVAAAATFYQWHKCETCIRYIVFVLREHGALFKRYASAEIFREYFLEASLGIAFDRGCARGHVKVGPFARKRGYKVESHYLPPFAI